MIPERLAWTGSVAMAGVGIYLSYVPLASNLGRGLVIGLASIVIVAALLMFPWKKNGDGSAARLGSRVRISGSRNHIQIAGDNSTQYQVGRDAKISATDRRGAK